MAEVDFTRVPISRRGAVEPFHVMEVLKAVAARERSHGDVVLLCVGQPSTAAPGPVLQAAHAALDSDRLGYTEAVGLRALREELAAHYQRWYASTVDPDDIILTTGSSAAFTALFLAAFDPGDEVIVTRPGYPAYRNTLHALGCRVVELDCGPDTGYQPSIEALDALIAAGARPAGLVVASPANPTGTVIGAAHLRALAGWCDDHEVLLISDEIYHGITYGEPATCARTVTPKAVVVGSFSKYFSMTGWRLGWLVAPKPLVRPIELLLGNLNLCPPTLPQHAALAAFTPAAQAELAGHVARYAANRDILLRRLPELGIVAFAPPDGAFYAYCDVSHLTDDSLSWCHDVLRATGVALTPGIDFATTAPARGATGGATDARPGQDPALDGSRFVRISFAGSAADIDEGIDRLRAHLGR